MYMWLSIKLLLSSQAGKPTPNVWPPGQPEWGTTGPNQWTSGQRVIHPRQPEGGAIESLKPQRHHEWISNACLLQPCSCPSPVKEDGSQDHS